MNIPQCVIEKIRIKSYVGPFAYFYNYFEGTKYYVNVFNCFI